MKKSKVPSLPRSLLTNCNFSLLNIKIPLFYPLVHKFLLPAVTLIQTLNGSLIPLYQNLLFSIYTYLNKLLHLNGLLLGNLVTSDENFHVSADLYSFKIMWFMVMDQQLLNQGWATSYLAYCLSLRLLTQLISMFQYYH